MSHSPAHRLGGDTAGAGLSRWLPRFYAGLGLAAIGLWLFVAWRQVSSPMELLTQEGGVVDHIRRVTRGQPIYVEPSLQFVPFLYTPGYYWVAAAFAWIGDLAFVVPRAVSAVATIASMGCLALMVQRGGGSRLWATIAAGIFALGASRVEAWYALAQVDSLFMLMLALAMATLQTARSARSHLVAGLLLAAAFWCKQSALLAGLVVVIGIAVLQWRWAMAVLGGLALGIVPLLLWLSLSSDGWFLFYAFAIPARYAVELERLGLLLYDLPRLLPSYLIGLGAIWIWWRDEHRAIAIRWLTIAAALGATALAGRLHLGGHVNTLIPAIWLTALALGVGAPLLLKDAGRLQARWVGPVALALIGLQLALLAYNPARFLPAANGAAVVAQMRATVIQAGGPALLPGYGFLIGEVAGADPAAFLDVANVDEALRKKLFNELAEAMHSRRYRVVVIEDYARQRYAARYEPYYQALGPLAPDLEAQRPRAGLDFGPPWLLQRR